MAERVAHYFTITDLPAPTIQTQTEAYLSEVEDVITDLLRENGLASIIVDDMRDYFLLDVCDRIRKETNVGRIFELIEHDPWNNDERVACAGFLRIIDRLNRMDKQERIRCLFEQRHYLPTVIRPRIAAHPTSKWLLILGITIIYDGLPDTRRGIPNAVPDFDGIGAWEWDNLFGVLPDTFDYIVRAIAMHASDTMVQQMAALALYVLLEKAEQRQRQLEIVNRWVQAPVGSNKGMLPCFDYWNYSMGRKNR